MTYLGQREAVVTAFASVSEHPAQAVEVIREAFAHDTAPLWQGDAEAKRHALTAYFQHFKIAAHPVLDPVLESAMVEGAIVEGGPEDGADTPGDIAQAERFTLKPTFEGPITLTDCRDFHIDLSGTEGRFDERPKFALTLINCQRFTITGGALDGIRNGMILSNCYDFSIRGISVSKAEGYGVIVMHCEQFAITDCSFLDCLASGIYCLGACRRGLVDNNICHGGKGFYNWDAGIHLNHCTPEMTLEDVPERSHEDARIVEKTLKPTELYFTRNHCSQNRAQGIYCEGVLHCYFEGNFLWRNTKEGICLDWGSSGNVFVGNNVMLNGERANLTPEEIKADFIAHYPMLEDGSSSAKLPGLSIDNGACNLIYGNKVQMNFGGGVKTVRAGIGNVIAGNRIFGNALGRNFRFENFHAILLFTAPHGPTEFDLETANLDFYPSEWNYILDNVVRVSHGDNIVRKHGSVENFVERNTVQI